MALEPRLLFDGAVGATALTAVDIGDTPHAPVTEASAPALLVVDPTVAGWRELLPASLPADTRVLVLDAKRDALTQIVEAAEGIPSLSALHMLSHGMEGGLRLNGQILDAAALSARGVAFSRLGNALTEGADVVLYGCDVGAGHEGAAFVHALAAALGADVAASDDATGAAALGGDWDLEVHSGVVAAPALLSAAGQSAYAGLLAATPSATLAETTKPVLIGEDFSFAVTFDNTGAPETGFAPYIVVFVPSAGRDPDNVSNTAGAVAQQEGITISGATYLGLPLTLLSGTLTSGSGTVATLFGDGGTAPTVAIPTGYQAGDRYYTIQLPFGSFTSGQPAIDITVNGSLGGFADVETDLPITVLGGFRFGQDALDNPGADAPILGSSTVLTVNPELYRVTTTYIGPEDETATGPNYLRGYRIDVDIAAGQTLTNLALSQILQDEASANEALRFVRITGTPASIGGTSIGATPAGGWTNVNGALVSTVAADTTTPALGGTTPILSTADVAQNNGGTVTRTIASATGTTSAIDASMVVQFYVTEFNENGAGDANRVIDRTTANSTFWNVDTEVTGNWNPTDADDADRAVTYNSDTDEPSGRAHRLEAEAIAIQKSGDVITNVSGGDPTRPTPGDIIEYTLDIQVSDFFALDDITVRDMVSDGQTVLALGSGPGQFTPTLVISYNNGAGNYVSQTLNFTGGRFSVVSAGQGTTGFGTPDSAGYFDALGAVQNVAPTETRSYITFDVAGLLQDNALDPRVVGDLLNGAPANGASTAVIRFRTSVDEAYTDRDAGAGANLNLNEGDTLENAVTVDGRNLDFSLASTGNREFDDSAEVLAIETEEIDLSIYARNGDTSNTGGRLTRLVPGDTITYRMRYTVPTGDYDNFTLATYLPLPTLTSIDFDADGTTDADLVPGGLLNNFTLAASGNTPSAAVPNAGEFSYGPTHFASIQVGNDAVAGNARQYVHTDESSNGIIFDFGTRDDAAPDPRVIDVLFTVRAADDPFASEGFFLTALAEHIDENTPGVRTSTQDIEQITLTQPLLTIQKGVVRDAEAGAHTFQPRFLTDDTTTQVSETALITAAATTGDGLAATITNANRTQLDTDAANVDGDDTVRYAVVVRNSGSANDGAFDIRVRDTLPYSLTAADTSNIRITRGNATTAVDYTVGGVVQNATTGAPITTEAAMRAALFGSDGIEFVDAPTTGFLGRGADNAGSAVTDGSNLLVISYDVRLPGTLTGGSASTTSAELLSYSGRDGAAGTLAAPDIGDYTQLAALDTDGTVDGRLTEEATITLAGALIDKTLLGTSGISDPTAPVFTADTNAVIGEQARYRVVLSLVEGVLNGAQFTDTLDAGLAFVGIDSVTFDPDITSSLGADSVIEAGISGANFTNSGRTFTLSLGNLVNADIDNTSADTITIDYRVVVLDTVANQAGQTRDNASAFSANGGAVSVTDTAPVLTIREPSVSLAVTPDAGTADAGDTVTFTVTVTNPGTIDAHDVDIAAFTLPAGLTYVANSWTQTAGTSFTLPAGFDTDITNGAATRPSVGTLAAGQSATFTFQAAMNTSVNLGTTLTVSGTTRWSSLPDAANGGVPFTNLSPFVGADDTERDGSGGVNDYVVTDTGSVTVTSAAPILRIVGSSEASTSPTAGGVESTGNPRTDTRVAVGEIVRYRMVVQLPESTSPELRITPALPPGLQYLNDGTTTVGFISDGGLTSGGAAGLAGGGLAISDAAFAGGTPAAMADVLTASPTFLLPGGNIPYTAGSGNDPVFRLGDVVNADSDADGEFIVMEFNALVTNESFNQPGRVIGDGTADPGTADPAMVFDVSIDTGGGSTVVLTSNAVTETLIEPDIVNVDKRVVATNGSLVTYEVTFSNSGTATAHDVVFIDEFAGVADITFGGAASVTPTVGAGVTGVTNQSDADTAALAITEIAAGGTVTVRYTATAAPGSVVTGNPAIVTYSSLATSSTEATAGGEQLTFGALTSTGGAAGSATGERTGADGVQANEADAADRTAPLNNFRDQDTAGLGTIAGTLWDDTDTPDGTIGAGETRLAGQTVTLRWAGTNGTFGDGDDSVLTTTTDASGAYSFSALPAGNYRVTGPGSVTRVIGADTDIAVPRFDAGGGTVTDGLIDLTLGEAQSRTSQDIGYERPNDAPVATPETRTTDETAVRNGNVLTGATTEPSSGTGQADTDVDAAPGQVIVQGAAVGGLTTNPGALTTGVGTALNGSFGTLVINADGSYTYTPDPVLTSLIPDGQTRNDVFTYTITDQGGSGAGGPLTANATVTITLTGVNQPPAGTDNTMAVTEDTDLPLSAADFGLSDPDFGDSVAAVRIDTLPASGTLLLNGTPVTAGQIIPTADLANLVYRPATNANRDLVAPPAFTFSARDTFGAFDPAPNSITFDVAPVNDPPTVGSSTLTVPGGSSGNALPGGLVSNPDGPGETITITVTGIPDASRGTVRLADGTPVTNGQTLTPAQFAGLTFTPDPALNGATNPDGSFPGGTLAYTASDGTASASGTVVFNVLPVPTFPPDVPVISPAPPPLIDVATGGGGTLPGGPGSPALPSGLAPGSGGGVTPVTDALAGNGGWPAGSLTPAAAGLIAPLGTLAPSIGAGLTAPLGDPVRNAVNDASNTRAANDARVAAARDPAALHGNGFFQSPRVNGFFGPEVIGPSALIGAAAASTLAPEAAPSALAPAAPEPAAAVAPPPADAGAPAVAAPGPSRLPDAPPPPPAPAAAPFVAIDPSPPPAEPRFLAADPAALEAARAQVECGPQVKAPVKPVKPKKRVDKRPLSAIEPATGSERDRDRSPAAKAFSEMVKEAQDTAKPKVKMKPKPKPKPKAKPAPAAPQC